MFRLSAAVAAIATVFAAGSANALFLSVDDFNTPDATIFDAVGGDAAGVTLVQGATRTLFHELISAEANGTGTSSNVKVGNDSFPDGRLQVANSPNIVSITAVSWTLAAGFVPAAGPVAFVFDIVDSDGVPVDFRYQFGANPSTFITTYNGGAIPPNPQQQLVIPLNAAEQAAFTLGGVFTLILDGNPGYDISIDSFGFQIPEPASLALAGLALLGAGAATRRRKAVKA